MTRFISQTASTTPAIIGEYQFGSDVDPTLNRVTGAHSAVIGAPAYQPGYATIGYSQTTPVAGFTLDVAVPVTVCVAMLVRVAAGGNPALLTTISDLSNFNMVAVDNRRLSCGNGQTFGATVQSVVTVPDPTKFSVVMGIGILATPSRAYLQSATGPIMNDGAALYLPNARAGGRLQLGGFVYAGLGGSFDISALAIVNQAMGSAFLGELYRRWTARAVALGLPVN